MRRPQVEGARLLEALALTDERQKLNETLADKPSSADASSQVEETDDSQLSATSEGSDNERVDPDETLPSHHDVDGSGGSEAAEASDASEGSEVSEPGETSEASEANESDDASEASEANEPDEANGEAHGNSQREAAADADDDDHEARAQEAQQGEVDERKGESEQGETLDGLFLSPDDDEDVIEVDYTDGEASAGGMEVLREDVSELHEKITHLEERAEKAEQERGDFKERWMRAAADLENLRKRAKREKEEQRKYGNDKIATELLPAVDNLERALAHAEKSEDQSSIIDGVKMVYRQILTALEKHGITGFESKGEKFNPEQHEAIQQVETTEHDTGTVVEQYQKGYFIHDRLLRPAMVSVAKRVDGGDNDGHSEASEASDSSDSTDDEASNADE